MLKHTWRGIPANREGYRAKSEAHQATQEFERQESGTGSKNSFLEWRTAMNKKSIIVFVLATTVLAGALVFDGVSHRRAVNNNQAIAQSPVTPTVPAASATLPKPDAGIPLDTPAAVTPGMDPAPQQTIDTASQVQPYDARDTDTVPVQPVVVKHVVVARTITPAEAPQPAPAPPVVLAAATGVDTNSPPPSVSKHTVVVPAGALLTIRLGEELGSDISEVGQSFSGTLDRDVTVNGKTAIAAGAAVTGKVAFARPVGPVAGEPTLELRVVSVNVNNSDIPVVTSIRSFGPKVKSQNKVSRFVIGVLKRYQHEEKEVVLDDQSAYSFTLRQPLQIR